MNRVCRTGIKEICLFCSNVVTSLRRALFIDALSENCLLNKLPHHFKVGFIEWELVSYKSITVILLFFVSILSFSVSCACPKCLNTVCLRPAKSHLSVMRLVVLTQISWSHSNPQKPHGKFISLTVISSFAFAKGYFHAFENKINAN